MQTEVINSESKRPFVIVTGEQVETRFMLKALLEMWDFEVVEACGGRESVEAAEKRAPDLVLMDATLPFDDSLETMSLIKDKLSESDVPFVVVSGFSRPDFKQAALSHGATEFLVKPLDFDVLQDHLHHLIDQKHDARVFGGP